jgi:hypothetical protein
MSQKDHDRFEAAWQAGDNLAFLWDQLASRTTSRQRRLFSIACLRSGKRRPGKDARQVIDVVERYVDGAAGPEDLAKARGPLHVRGRRGGDIVLASDDEEDLARAWSLSIGNNKQRWRSKDIPGVRQRLLILHEIVGNPHRDCPIHPSLLAWNEGTIPRLAEAIYQEHAFERMGILGDALEEAGCADGALLAHCRQPARHCRGCWVLDALTGRA